MEPSGRLELTWTNKHLRLITTETGGYDWVEPTDPRVSEVRLFHDIESVGEMAGGVVDNLLIEGDALHALTALNRIPELARHYAGQVRLVYIDPPFNTGQAFANYDDNLEHSVWLSMLRDRLVQIKPLLAPNGSIWVHLDDAEVHRCRCVMDEVLGSGNFIAEVIWRAADSSNNDAKQFSLDHNSILVYSRQPGWRSVPLARGAENNAHYSNPDGDPRGDWFPGNVSSPNPRDNLRFTVDQTFGWQGTPIAPPANGWRWQPSTLQAKLYTGEIVLHEAEPGRPRLVRKTYLADQRGLAPSTLWGDIEVTGHNRQAKYELKKLFPGAATADLFKTPKPERLLRRVLEVATNPGDLVLDCFAGSGTTAAVAHKMRRRWVTVEREADTVARFTRPRLAKVVAGEDPGGITTAVEWKGGGGFRHMKVGPSMLDLDAETGEVFLAEWATNGAFSEAVAAQLGFAQVDEPPFCGLKGRARLAVLDGVVGATEMEFLVASLGDRERAVVVGKAFTDDAEARLRQLSPGSRVRHAPGELLRKGGRR